MIDTDTEDLKDEIESLVDRMYEERDKTSMRTGLLTDAIHQFTELQTVPADVEAACEELVDEDRLRSYREDHKADEPRYASTKVPDDQFQRMAAENRS